MPREHPQPAGGVQVSGAQAFNLEDLLSQAHRCRDLLTGAKAWLLPAERQRRELGISSAIHSMMEARAELDGIVHALEGLAARKAEADRAEQAHRVEAAKLAARTVAP